VNGQIKVGIVEDHEILKLGLIASLSEDGALRVAALRPDTVAEAEIDIAIVSEAVARSVAFPCPIILWMLHGEVPAEVADGNEVVGALDRESVTVAQLRATVHAAAAGLMVNSQPVDGHGRTLDPRFRPLLRMLADGYSTREIAESMSYSERTIKKLVTELQTQLGARSRAQTVAVAIRRGLI
jgi:DNA-binding CsgD family transcriptional regulator